MVKAPEVCSPAELADFVSLVLAGGEVAPAGLPKRVSGAHSLAFLREGGCLIGVAGLKYPAISYRAKVEADSNVPLPADVFPIELGWAFVMPSARGGKSYQLCEPLLRGAGKHGVFATSRSGNIGMHKTLIRMGFAKEGREWESGRNTEDLWLFVRPAPN